MKQIMVGLLSCVLVIGHAWFDASIAEAGDPLHVALKTENRASACDTCGPGKPVEVWSLGTTIGFDALRLDLETKKYKAGVLPGVGWGLKFHPTFWKYSFPLLALDLFAELTLADEDSTLGGPDYIEIDALPVLTLLGWVSVGFGARMLLSIQEDLPNATHPILTLGIKQAL